MAKNQRNRSRNSHINSIIMQSLFVKREKNVQYETQLVHPRTGRILFYPNLAVEEVSNYKLLLGHSHFDYVPLDSHIRIKRIRPVLIS